jgi:hypothetical protein
MCAMSGVKMVLAMETHQAIMVGVDQKADSTAFTTIPAIGASSWDAFLAAETDHAIPAIAAIYVYLCSIVEHGWGYFLISSGVKLWFR